MGQDPLFSRTSAVEPNIVFLFDDSGSMVARHLYQYGGASGGYGKGGPDDLNQGNGQAIWAQYPTTYAGQSPDVNRIYYDPRVKYPRRIKADGTYYPNAPTAGITSFNVYFYNPPATPTYGVQSVAITNAGQGYPATGVIGRFNNAPLTGQTATATVTTAPSTIVSSVTVNNKGSDYPVSGVTATFDPPPAGGIQATATVTTSATNKVGSVTATAMGSGYPAAGVTATFSAPQLAGGATATGTPVIAARDNVASIAITNPGSGFTAGSIPVTFTASPTPAAGPANGVRATGTATAATLYKVTAGNATISSEGSGYSAPVSVTVNGTLTPGGTAANGSASIVTRYAVAANAISVTNPGTSSYAPSLPINLTGTVNPGGTVAQVTAVTTASMNRVASINKTANGSGCGASGPRTLSFTNPTYGTLNASGTATVSGGAVTSISFTASSGGGAGYTPTNVPTVTVLGCTVQPTFTVTLGTAYNGLTAVTNSAGSGYTAAPTFTPSNGATTTVASTAYNAIGSVTLTAGSGYTSAPTLTITGATGSGAAATPATSTFVGLTSASVTNSGSGYPVGTTFTASVSGGSGATFAITKGSSNVITGVTVTSGGSGYSSAPTITLGNTNPGTGAVMTPVLSNTGRWITSINMTNYGAGYTSTPNMTLGNTGTGSGATWTVNTGTTNVISAVNVLNSGSGYFSVPTLTLTAATGSGATFAITTVNSQLAAQNRYWDGNTNNPNPNTAAQYFTPSYTPDAGTNTDSPDILAVGADATRAYPNTASATTSFYPKFIQRTDCVTAAGLCTWAEELQNYANWLTYHSTRTELAKTGIGNAFQPLNATFRLGWGTINDTDSNNRLISGVRLYNYDGTAVASNTPSASTKTDFLYWLYNISINGGTPNRSSINKVGQYYQRGDDNGPWASSPPAGNASIAGSGTDVATHASCRRSYALLMTDGYYNENFYMADVDSSVGPQILTPTPYQYKPVGPYSDNVSGTPIANSFADVAMKYWSTDLRPTLENRIKPTALDPAYWQHMNFYAIGLGLQGTYNSTSAQVLQSLTGDSTTSPPRVLDWPTATATGGNAPYGNGPAAIDDMWHATINGHGKIYNAKTTSELTSAINSMLSDVAGAEGTQAGVAVSTATLKSDTRKYTPSYTPITWTGNVTAYNLDTNASQVSVPAWQVETLTYTDPVTGVRTYQSTMPIAANRNIYVGNGSSSGTRAVPFTYSAMGSSLLTQMGSSVSSDLIDYLRGDATNEDTATNSLALYRRRETRLGDIVNSTPVFVKDLVDLSYETLPSTTAGQSTYRAFVDGTGATPTGGKKQRAEGILVVGANDGMVHAFRDGTKDAASGNVINPGGVEVFAYVPNAILPTLNLLSNKGYGQGIAHQYFVDGPLIETDGYLSSAGRWGNLVLGTTGAGTGTLAKNGVSPTASVYALDVTALNTSPTALSASSVLWEVNSKTSGFDELGYVLTELEAGPTVDGEWVAIFGNGYGSKSCHAQLFVVNLETGALIKRIDTGAGSGNCSDKTNVNRNGLGGVKAVRDAKQQIVGVYAGDLLGNLWKFDLSSGSGPSAWVVDLAGQPLFKAGTSKPITTAPSVTSLTATSTPAGGYMVNVGTGKFFEVDDIANNNVQTLYGIWDPVPFGTAVSTTVLTDTSRLIQQSIQPGVVASNGNTYFDTSHNVVDYSSTQPNRGWYMNLPNTGERLIYPFELRQNRALIVDTISPANVSFDPCLQTTGGTGFTYVLDAITGQGPSTPIFDTNGDGNIDSNDLVAAGFQTSADGKNKTIGGESNASSSTYFNCSADSPTCTKFKLPCEFTNTCVTTTTTTVPQIESREWRQLFMR